MQTYVFGDFRLEPLERRLLHRGQVVGLTPKAFDTLVVLVEQHGRLVTKDELLRQVWPDAFVEENNLAQHVSSLRRALSEAGGEALIETVPRRGYRFIGAVTVAPDGPPEPLESPALPAVAAAAPARPEGLDESPGTSLARPPGLDATAEPRGAAPFWRRAVLPTLAVIALGAVVWPLVRPSTAPRSRVIRYAFPVEPQSSLVGRIMAISPDGAWLAYLSPRGLVLQSRDRAERVVIQMPGIGAHAPFFSPDGRWVGFADEQNLYKAPVGGGPAQAIARVETGAVGSWGPAGIVFSDVRGLFRLSPQGSTPEPLLEAAEGVEQPAFPEFLPGGKAVLFTVVPTRTILVGASPDMPGSRIDVLDLQTGQRRTVVHGASRGHYLPTGHLVYIAGDALHAVAFDAERLETRGTPVPVLPQVARHEFAVADDGTLAYMTGGAADGLTTLAWVDRQGREEVLPTPPRLYRYPRLSPDGAVVALDASMPERDIWTWDLARQTLERFTVDPAANPLVAWSPDGRMVAFGSDRFGPTQMFLQPADGSAPPVRLLESDRLQMPVSFTPDGRLLFSEAVPGNNRDLHMLWMDGSRRVEPLVHSPGTDATAEVSPDGRWLAYDSDESGQFEVYVRPFPDAGRGRWQISVGGGRQPLWSPDGRELFYRDFSGAVLSAPVTASPAFAVGPVARILDGANYAGAGRILSARTYDISRDGRRFLMLKRVDNGASERAITVVLNWFEELAKLTR